MHGFAISFTLVLGHFVKDMLRIQDHMIDHVANQRYVKKASTHKKW